MSRSPTRPLDEGLVPQAYEWLHLQTPDRDASDHRPMPGHTNSLALSPSTPTKRSLFFPGFQYPCIEYRHEAFHILNTLM